MKFFKTVLLGAFFTLFLIPSVPAFAQVTTEIDAEFEQNQDTLDDIQDRLDTVGDQIQQYNFETVEKKGKVIEVVEDIQDESGHQMVLDVEAEGEVYRIDTREAYLEGVRYKVKKGDHVFIQVVTQGGEVEQVFLVDVVRYGSLWWIGLFFLVVVVAVGRKRGLLAIVGLSLTLGIIFGAVIPLILQGHPPLFIAFLASLAILGVNMPLAHGFHKSTVLAFLSTAIGATFVLIFAEIFTHMADLTGLASEDAVLLYYQDTSLIIPRGILLAGILLGAVGVLDDIAITQTEVVAELKAADPKLSRQSLYTRAMRVGRHHIASTVNTLVLAYTGVALPLLILFLFSNEISLLRFLNEEPLVEEVVRTVAGTLGLVLTVPISTWLATLLTKEEAEGVHSHHSHGSHDHKQDHKPKKTSKKS